MSCDIFIFAGEASGDLHGEKLIESLLEKDPSLRIYGVGGPRMRAKKFHCPFPTEKFQVMGFLDVFLRLPKLVLQFYAVRNTILKLKPKIVITIDYPGFNLRLAKSLKNKKFLGKICHYICPSVWAHGKNRISFLIKYFDLLLTIFPFEKNYFPRSFNVHYIGHPLTERIPQIFPLSFEKKIALFPGSRKKEIERNLPLYLQVLEKLLKEDPSLKFAISLSSPSYKKIIENHFSKINLKPVYESNEHLIKTSSFALAKSGTITLELGLYGLPTIVTYALSTFDLWIAKYILKLSLPYYCIVNLLCQKEVFPELIGPALSKQSLYEKCKKLLDNPENLIQCHQECKKLHSILGSFHPSKEAANHIIKLGLAI